MSKPQELPGHIGVQMISTYLFLSEQHTTVSSGLELFIFTEPSITSC